MIDELNQQRGINSLRIISIDKAQAVSTIPFPAITFFGAYAKQPSFIRRWVGA